MSRTIRILVYGLCLASCCGCTARDLVYAFFGGNFRSGEGLSVEERRMEFNAEVDHWNSLGRAAPER